MTNICTASGRVQAMLNHGLDEHEAGYSEPFQVHYVGAMVYCVCACLLQSTPATCANTVPGLVAVIHAERMMRVLLITPLFCSCMWPCIHRCCRAYAPAHAEPRAVTALCEEGDQKTFEKLQHSCQGASKL